MSYKTFNCTLPIVKTEIDYFLQDYSIEHPYQKALSINYFREKLLAKILSNIPNAHVVIDNSQNFADCLFNKDISQIKSLIKTQIIINIPKIVEEYKNFNLISNLWMLNHKQSSLNYYPDSLLWIVIDDHYIIKAANEEVIKILKLSKKEIIDKSFISFLNLDYVSNFCCFLDKSNAQIGNKQENSFSPIYQLLLPKQNSVFFSIKASRIKNVSNNTIGWHLYLYDVTKWRSITNKSAYNYLPNLSSRSALSKFLQTKLIHEHKNYSNQCAVLFLDINKFKQINQTFGYQVGDIILIAFAKRLMTCIRSFDHIARLNGDEFMIVLSHLSYSEEAKNCVTRIQQSLSSCFQINQYEIMISVSIGIVISKFKDLNISNILLSGGMAMCKAKNNAELFAIYHC